MDWTESPYVAAFFAFSKKEEYKNLSQDLFENLKSELSPRTMKRFEAELKDNISVQTVNRAVYALNNKDLQRWYEKRKTERNILVESIDPSEEDNARAIAQRCIFTYTLRREDIIKRVKSCYGRADEKRVILIKITIPNKDREECLKSLNQMNINHVTLFPDLYGATMYSNLSLEIENY